MWFLNKTKLFGYNTSPSLFSLQIFLFCTYRVLYILYMMSSLGSDKARGPREKAIPAATHTSQQQKQIQVSGCKKWKNLIEHFYETLIVKQDACVHAKTHENKSKRSVTLGMDFYFASRHTICYVQLHAVFSLSGFGKN